MTFGLPTDLAALSREIHADNIRAGWWQVDEETRRTRARNVGELLALVHSEISEADHGFQFGLADDKLPHRTMVEVELADVAIRVLDMLGFYGVECHADDTFPQAYRLLVAGGGFTAWTSLMHRVTTQALEGFRKGSAERGCAGLVELLHIVHLAGRAFELDLAGAIAEKRAFNAQRADHKPENRAAIGGKQF